MVLIGATAAGPDESHATPFADRLFSPATTGANLMAGVEVQANILATLADRAFIRSIHADGGVFRTLAAWTPADGQRCSAFEVPRNPTSSALAPLRYPEQRFRAKSQ